MKQRLFIIGAGRFGTHLAKRLSEFGGEVVVADKDGELAEAGLRERYRVNVVLLTRPGPKETPQPLEPEPGLKLALNDPPERRGPAREPQ